MPSPAVLQELTPDDLTSIVKKELTLFPRKNPTPDDVTSILIKKLAPDLASFKILIRRIAMSKSIPEDEKGLIILTLSIKYHGTPPLSFAGQPISKTTLPSSRSR